MGRQRSNLGVLLQAYALPAVLALRPCALHFDAGEDGAQSLASSTTRLVQVLDAPWYACSLLLSMPGEHCSAWGARHRGGSAQETGSDPREMDGERDSEGLASWFTVRHPFPLSSPGTGLALMAFG